jgi:predicted nucleic acid-binding protein
MPDFVVDASATLSWCFQDEAVDWVDALFQNLDSGVEIVVPRHWALEVANALLVAMRRGRITKDGLRGAIRILFLLPIRNDDAGDSVVFTVAIGLAEKHRLSVYDAAYVELAMRANLPLATLDDDLRRAAVAEGITLVN